MLGSGDWIRTSDQKNRPAIARTVLGSNSNDGQFPGSGDWIRTSDLVVTRNPLFS